MLPEWLEAVDIGRREPLSLKCRPLVTLLVFPPVKVQPEKGKPLPS